MRPPWLISLVAACISPVVSVQAHAQPLFSDAESIECTVANADLVVLGRLVEFGGGGQANGREGREATIAVEEILKGERHQRLRVDLSDPVSALTGWKVHSRRLLVAVKGDVPTAATVIDLSDENLEVLTAEFRLLRDPEDVIQVAKETVRRMPAAVRRIHTFGLVVPRDAVAGTTWEKYYATGGHLRLQVPVDERLEKKALDSIRSESLQRREEGVRALRYFKTDENIARVKRLLSDPGWAYLHHAGENKGLEVRIYTVREESYQALKYWGVDAENPMTREEILKPGSVKTVSLSNTQVTDTDLKELARFENLENLFLWNTAVTDARLKELGGLKNLKSLYLGGTEVTDQGLKHLAGLKSLQHLDLRSTKVTDQGLEVLAGYQSLQKLDLGRAPVTDEGVAELRKRCPGLKIER